MLLLITAVDVSISLVFKGSGVSLFRGQSVCDLYSIHSDEISTAVSCTLELGEMFWTIKWQIGMALSNVQPGKHR